VIEAKARADKRYWLTNCRAISAIRSRSLSGSIMPLGAVIVMDSDLQDPPEVVLEMIAKWKQGYDVVSAERASTSRRKPVQAGGRESLLSPHGTARRCLTPRNAGDFHLVDRQALRRPRHGQRRH